MKPALLVLAACGHAAPPQGPPANHVEETPRAAAVTHLVVLVVPGYDKCAVLHHVDVVMDDKLAVTVEARSPCPPPPQTVNGHTVYVTDNQTHPVLTKPFDVAPGHHVFVVTDRETGIHDTLARDFPVYDESADHRPLGELGVNVDETMLRLLGIAHEFILL